MLEKDLKLDRFLGKDPNQNDGTKNAVYTASNPVPKRGNDELKKIGRPKGSEEDDGAPNILTGTVITSCFIQTSALPSRIELEGNNLTFYDDTYTLNGSVVGDTSRLIFTHDLNSDEGFIMEKRASVYDTYDNVLSWYASPAKAGSYNYMFIGRNATLEDNQRNLSSIRIATNQSSSAPSDNTDEGVLNGVFALEHSIDGVYTPGYTPFISGNTAVIAGGALSGGFSSAVFAGGGGVTGLGYLLSTGQQGLLLYILAETAVMLGADLIPDATGAYDIGSPTAKIGTLYGSVVACPLPTVDNALDILDTILPPAYVGERGHYGEDRKYFDDLTFPPELLFTDKKGRTDIEHNHMLGFLLKAVIELKAKVDLLERTTIKM